MFNYVTKTLGVYSEERFDNLHSGVINVKGFEHPTQGWLAAVPDCVVGEQIAHVHAVSGTDNSSVFNYARDLAETTGKPVFIPPGTYRLNSEINIKNYTPFIGCGTQSVLVSGNDNRIFRSVEDIYASGGYGIPANVLLSGLTLDMRPCNTADLFAIYFEYSLGYQTLEYLHFTANNWNVTGGIEFGSGGIGYRHRNIFQGLKFDYFRPGADKAVIYAPGDYQAGLQFNNNLFLNCNMYGCNINYLFTGDANIWMQCGLGIGTSADAVQINGSAGKYASIIVNRGYANQVIGCYCEGIATDVMALCRVNGAGTTNHPLNITGLSPGINSQASIVILDDATNEETLPVWTGETTYARYDLRRPTTPNGFVYEVATVGGGASGASEPTWGTTVGGATVDGAISWTCKIASAMRATYVSATSFSLKGNQTSYINEDDVLWCDMGVDGWRSVTVTARSYGAPNTTVDVSESRLTANLKTVYAHSGGYRSVFQTNCHLVGPRAPSVYQRRVRWAGTFTPNADLWDYYDLDLRGVAMTVAAPIAVSGHTLPKGQIITFDISLGSVGGTVIWNAVFKTTWTNIGNVSGAQAIISFQYDGTNWNQIIYKPYYDLSDTFRRDEITVSTAEIKAIRATPKTLVASPGAGKWIELISAVLIHDYATAAFTESADDLVIEYAISGVDATASIDATDFLTATADTLIKATLAAIPATALSSLVNNALQLKNTGDGEYGGATAEGIMKVIVEYRIHDDGV